MLTFITEILSIPQRFDPIVFGNGFTKLLVNSMKDDKERIGSGDNNNNGDNEICFLPDTTN